MSRLVNLGSLCIDHVYRLAELPHAGQTVASTSHRIFAGGKGLNQSLAAARAGARVSHVGSIGPDGQMLIDVLQKAGVDVSGIRIEPQVVSGHAVIQVNDRGENAIVIAGGANRCVTAADCRRALRLLGQGDWLLLQNEINDLPRVLEGAAQARTRGARVAFNIAPPDGRERDYDLAEVDLLIVNDSEARALLDASAEPDQVLASLSQRWPDLTVVLTLGRDGLLYCHEGRFAHIDAHPVVAVDETAAGDAFIGYLMAELIAGSSLEDALRTASAAGALAVTVAGAASSIPGRAAVQALVQSGAN